MRKKLPLSVSIISFNEEDNIGRTLDSIKDIASEIIVVDSHSNDRTREIAESRGAKVFEEDWKGFIAQKNSALEKCKQEWIFSLDCDEVVSEELKKSVIENILNPKADGYLINRKTSYLGKFLKYAWQPDWNLFLVKKTTNPRLRGHEPHWNLKINGSTKKINGFLYHYSYRNIEDHFERTIIYARIGAESYHNRGEKFRPYKLLFNPVWAFTKVYIIKRGFLDGYRGAIVSVSSFLSVFLKYFFLWEMEEKNVSKPDQKEETPTKKSTVA